MVRTRSIHEASTHALIEAHPDQTLLEVHAKLCDHNAVVVVGPAEEYQGIVTRKDAIRVILDRKDWKEVRVSEIMTRDVLHVPNHVTLADAAKIMLDEDIHQLVITGPAEGGGVAAGILTLQDILRNAV